MKTNLNIYFSQVCNLQCKYCAHVDGEVIENSKIRGAILNNSFQSHVINKCRELQPVTLGIWGMEPTINQDLWPQFIIPILENCETIKGIFLSTNGILFNYHLWADCLVQFCTINQRKIKLWIQFSVDGPQRKNLGVNNLINCCKEYSTNEYFRLKLSTKSTFIRTDLYQDIEQWWSYMNSIKDLCQKAAQPNCDISLVASFPTLACPEQWTKEDGIRWAEWHPPLITNKWLDCPAGKTSWTIDYKGQIYDCILKRNFQSDDVEYFTDINEYNQRYYELINGNHIDNSQNYERLLYTIKSQWCWGIMQQHAPDYIYNLLQVWGNGAIPQED